MYVSGHLATAYLCTAVPALAKDRRPALWSATLPAMLGAVLPDIIDKPLHYLGLTAYTRALGHSLFFVLALGLIWTYGRWAHQGRLRRRSWWASGAAGWLVVGLGSHHVADLANDVVRSFEGRGLAFTGSIFWPISDHRSFTPVYSFAPEIHPYLSVLELAIFATTAAVIAATWWVGRRPVNTARRDH